VNPDAVESWVDITKKRPPVRVRLSRWRFAVCLAVVVAAASTGCEPPPRPPLTELKNIQINNGIIRQRTIFPYHFLPETAQLNELGVYDLEVLAGYFRDHPGRLNVRKGEADERLYEARIKAAVAVLARAGVDTSRIAIVDVLPPGDGMPSERVIAILEIDQPSPAPASEGFTLPAAFSVPPSTGDIPAMQ